MKTLKSIFAIWAIAAIIASMLLSTLNAQTVEMVADFNPSGDGFPSGAYANFRIFNNKLYFFANDSSHGYEPWVTDDTGTKMLKDINPGRGSGYFSPPYDFNLLVLPNLITSFISLQMTALMVMKYG